MRISFAVSTPEVAIAIERMTPWFENKKGAG
jgi:hypothetical protein